VFLKVPQQQFLLIWPKTPHCQQMGCSILQYLVLGKHSLMELQPYIPGLLLHSGHLHHLVSNVGLLLLQFLRGSFTESSLASHSARMQFVGCPFIWYWGTSSPTMSCHLFSTAWWKTRLKALRLLALGSA
jgi:hypothetical protein